MFYILVTHRHNWCLFTNTCLLLSDPPHFKYSPEHLKKSLSCQQPEEILKQNRPGRRQSGKLYGGSGMGISNNIENKLLLLCPGSEHCRLCCWKLWPAAIGWEDNCAKISGRFRLQVALNLSLSDHWSCNQTEKGIYDLDSKFWWSGPLCGHMTKLWVLSNTAMFMTICSILWS